MELKDKFEYTFSFSQKDVDNFAAVTGDNNPIHINKKQAAQSIFQKRIMHGFLSGSIFSKVFGTIWPGNGTIYLSQTMNFLKPMYAGQKYLAKFEVTEIISNSKVKVSTIIKSENNKNTIEGFATIKYNS